MKSVKILTNEYGVAVQGSVGCLNYIKNITKKRTSTTSTLLNYWCIKNIRVNMLANTVIYINLDYQSSHVV